MVGLVLRLTVLLVLLGGCASTTEPTSKVQPRTMQRDTLLHDGLEREYFVYSPNVAATERRPALLFLHGYGGSATGTEAETTNGLNRYASEYGFMVVYPQGSWFEVNDESGEPTLVTSWNDLAGNRDEGPEGALCAADAPRYPCPPECGDCGRCGWTSCHDDVGFLSKLLQRVAELPQVDSSRIFIGGFSNGAMMAHRMACVAGDKLAAVALVGGRLERGYQCAPDGPLPLLQINGGRDDAVPYAGALADSAFYYASAPQVAKLWAQHAGCAETATTTIPDSATQQLSCTERCANSRRENINCLWPDGGHVWPGYPTGHGSFGYCASALQQASLPQTTRCVAPDESIDVWGSRLMFDFFSRHRLDG